MKSKEELDALKKEVESVNEKLQELTPEEVEKVFGGGAYVMPPLFVNGSSVLPG